MREVFVVSDNIVSPLGSTTEENFRQLQEQNSGIQKHQLPEMAAEAFYASLIPDAKFSNAGDNTHSRFEKLLIHSIEAAIKNSVIDVRDKRTVFILSSTKGNISLVEKEANTVDLAERTSLHGSANRVAEWLGLANTPIVLSNACISGVMALLLGKRLIQSGVYDHAIVAGADTITKFILSGFQSFQAISSEPCKPFDADRNGITLGEAAGTVILTGDTSIANLGLKLGGGSVSNDANHISGPSRTGEPLYEAINIALKQSGLNSADIGFISAHGTATIYNDEMEAKAISLAGMEQVPVNSLKGYYGHTLGAAGLIESIISMHSLLNNKVIPSKNFSKSGVSKPIYISTKLLQVEIKNCLKTASGFGGCNAAMVFSKV